MKAKAIRTIDKLAAQVGASGWTLIRENKHLIVDFHFAGQDVRQVMAATASDQRAVANVKASVRRAAGGRLVFEQ